MGDREGVSQWEDSHTEVCVLEQQPSTLPFIEPDGQDGPQTHTLFLVAADAQHIWQPQATWSFECNACFESRAQSSPCQAPSVTDSTPGKREIKFSKPLVVNPAASQSLPRHRHLTHSMSPCLLPMPGTLLSGPRGCHGARPSPKQWFTTSSASCSTMNRGHRRSWDTVPTAVPHWCLCLCSIPEAPSAQTF